MAPRCPRCLLNGRFFHGGITGVSALSDHPCSLIPHLVPDAPGVQVETPGGVRWWRPERCVSKDEGLMLHHYASTRPGQVITQAELAAMRKTSDRYHRLLSTCRSLTPIPLEWPLPEWIVFTTEDDMLFVRQLAAARALVSLESLELRVDKGRSTLIYRRC